MAGSNVNDIRGSTSKGPALSSAAYGCEVVACNRTALSRYCDTVARLITRPPTERFRIERTRYVTRLRGPNNCINKTKSEDKRTKSVKS